MDIISETQNSKTQNFMNKVLDLELKWAGYRLKKFQDLHVQDTNYMYLQVVPKCSSS